MLVESEAVAMLAGLDLLGTNADLFQFFTNLSLRPIKCQTQNIVAEQERNVLERIPTADLINAEVQENFIAVKFNFPTNGKVAV